MVTPVLNGVCMHSASQRYFDSQTEEGVGDWHYWLKRGYVL